MKIAKDIYLVGSGQIGISSELDCHIYLVDHGEEASLIDAGCGKNESDINLILKNIEREKIDPNKIKRIFLTHGHSDHAGGASILKDKLNCCIYAGSITRDIVSKGSDELLGLDFAKNSGFYGDDYVFKTFDIDKIINDNDEIVIGTDRIRAIHTMGHSDDSMCYLIKKDNKILLFTGDVVGHGGKFVLLNCHGFDLGNYRKSIKKLAGLSVDMLFPGHGLFTLENGQSHIDKLVDAFNKLLINDYII